jgi:hypothetical protein
LRLRTTEVRDSWESPFASQPAFDGVHWRDGLCAVPL